MKKSYEVIMDKIKVTQAMRERILKHLQLEENSKPSKPMRLVISKKYISIAACFILLVVGAFLVPNLINPPQPVIPDVDSGFFIEDVSSANELSALVGFDVIDLENLPSRVNQATYTAYGQYLAQIIYECDDEQTVVFRKSIGNEDNSGDYNTYETETEVVLGSLTVTLMGDSQTHYLAIWTDETYSYSLSFSMGISQEQIADIILEVK